MKKFLRFKQSSVPSRMDQMVAPDSDQIVRPVINSSPDNSVETRTRLFRLEVENRKLKEAVQRLNSEQIPQNDPPKLESKDSKTFRQLQNLVSELKNHQEEILIRSEIETKSYEELLAIKSEKIDELRS